jgi:hypothetical protein
MELYGALRDWDLLRRHGEATVYSNIYQSATHKRNKGIHQVAKPSRKSSQIATAMRVKKKNLMNKNRASF